MERLLLLQLESGGVAAEVLLNGMAVAALGPGGGRTCIAVHEFTLAGRNQLAVVVAPVAPGRPATPQPRVATTPTWARARLVLSRPGMSPNDPNIRVLAELEWAATEGKPFEAPTTVSRDVELPVNFPRWRWLDAPPVALNAASQRTILEFIQLQAVELGHGNPDPLLAASKLRFDELALAYQRNAADLVALFRAHLQGLFEKKALKIVPPTAEELVLRPLADGRLIECLSPLGGPALRTQNDDPVVGNHAWPVRLAMVEGRIYVLR
jgi:hypothetical protein